MKIQIKRLGRIKRAELDIKPITILVGENNTNKSWTAYAIYALLRAMSESVIGEESHTKLLNNLILKRIRTLASGAAKRISEAPSEASITFEFSRRAILQEFADDITLTLPSKDLARILAVSDESVAASKVSLSIPGKFLAQGSPIFVLSRMTDGGIIYGPRFRKRLPQSIDLQNLDVFFNARTGRGRVSIDYPLGGYRDWELTIRNLLTEYTLAIFDTVFPLPAERKGLVSLYKALSDKTEIRLPLPLWHFIGSLHSAESRASSMDGRRSSFAYAKKYSALERKLLKVLGGQFKWEGQSRNKQLAFSPNSRVTLPIQASSSIVRSLAGLSIALEQFRHGKNVLVIDEPEMNAHPKAQLAMVEIIALLANMGNYVIATTHSPYIVDHFNNLLAAAELKNTTQRTVRNKFALKDEKSFLSITKVSAYELDREGLVKDLVDPARRRIATTTFGNVSNTLEDLYNDILELKRG